MGALADEYVRVRADTSYMGRDLKKQGAASGKSFGGSFSGALKAVFASAAVIGAAKLLAGGLKTAVMAASDMNETANKSRIIFGKLSPVVTKFASTAAKDLGLTKQQALEAASSFGDMFTQIGFTGKEVTRMSLNVVRLSADLGSFNNLPTEDVQNRIAAAFRGEYDSLQALVPTINAAAVQQRAMDDTGKKNAKSLTAQEKASATLAIVMESTKRAAGDFERTQGGLANQIKIAKAQLGDMAAEIGQSLLPSLSKLFGYITKEIIPAFQDFFDNLSKDKALKTAVQNLKDALVTLTGDVDFKATLDSIAKALPPIVQGLADVVTKYKEIADAIDKFENQSFGGGDKVGGPVGQIIKDFGPGGTIETALVHFRTAAPAFIKQGWADVKAAFTADVISPLVRTFGPGGTIETALTHFRAAAAEKIRQAWTEIKGLFAAGWAAVKAGVSVAVSAIASALKAAVDAWTLPIRVAMTAIGTIMVLAWMAIRKPVLAAFTYIRDRIIKPYWAAIVDLFRSAMATIRAAWTAFWNAVKTTSAAAWEAVRSRLAAVWAQIRSAWTAAQTAVRTAWTTFWNAIKTAASAAWEAVRANLAAVWARVKGLFTSNQTAVKSSWSGFWTSVKTTASNAINAVRTSVTTVLGRIRDAFRTTVGNIKTIWNGVKSAVSGPINWVKDNVYNKPLVPVWNRVASLVSGPKLSTYAQGGEIRGPRHGRDNVLGISRRGTATAMVEPGEWIAPRWMSSLFPQLESIRKQGRSALRDVGDPKNLPGFAGGGLVGWAKGLASNVSSKVGSLKDWALGGLRAAAAKILDPVKGLIGKAMPNSGVGSTVGNIGKKLIDLILDKIKSSDAAAMPALGGPAGSAIASGGWASIYRVLRAAGARSFTTYAGHDQGASRSRDIWPPSQAVAEAARRLSSIWYVIYNRRIASVTYGMRWRPYTRSNPHTDHVHVTLKPGVKAAMGGMAPMGQGLMNGGLIKGGRGGVLAHIGEGRRDELVTPLPRNWQRGTGSPLDARLDRLIAVLEARGNEGLSLDLQVDVNTNEPRSVRLNKALQQVGGGVGLVGELMVYSAFPITVDGVSLDTVAWNIDAKVRQWAGARAADIVLPGVDGVAPSLNDDLEPTVMTLSMWVAGTNTSGLVPLGNGIAQARDNLDQLVHLFGKRHALLDVREIVDAGSTTRQAWCKVVESVAPELRASALGRFSVSLLIPAGVWQDVNTADWASTPTLVSGNFYEITTLQGATGPIDDAIITVTGPVTNPQLTDFMTGAYVRLNAALAAGTVWRLNIGTWASRYAAGLGLGSADTTGTDGQSVTVYGGGNARFLRQVPGLITGARRVQIALTGTGITSATAIGVRARRKYRQ